MTIETKQINNVVEYIKKAEKLLPEQLPNGKENPNKKFYQEVPGYVDTALETLKKYDGETAVPTSAIEKLAFLYDAVTRWATQLTFMLWRFEALTPEIEEEFRKFEPFEVTTEAWAKYPEERTEKGKKLEEQRDVLIEEDRQMDIFKAIVSGMSLDEAKQKQAAYEAQMQQAMGAKQ